MSISEVKAGLNILASDIAQSRDEANQALNTLLELQTRVGGFVSKYNYLVILVDALGTDASELVYKDEKAKLQTEFVTLKNDLQIINETISGLGVNL